MTCTPVETPASGHAGARRPLKRVTEVMSRLASGDLDVTIEQELTVQVAAAPVATSEGVVGNPSDAHYTVYYDAVQFPSGITLDTPASAFAD